MKWRQKSCADGRRVCICSKSTQINLWCLCCKFQDHRCTLSEPWCNGCDNSFLPDPRWGLLSPYLIIFSSFSQSSKHGHLLKITFIFDRCRHSLAVVTPVKYECDSQDITDTPAKTRNILNGGFEKWEPKWPPPLVGNSEIGEPTNPDYSLVHQSKYYLEYR